ncbi:MAG: CCA tRNA nucleotidyltransferase, partial [Paracoccaceae bacterium]
ETPLPANWQSEIKRGNETVFPVSAADLMPALRGPALGQRLRELERQWIASGFSLTRAQLLS